MVSLERKATVVQLAPLDLRALVDPRVLPVQLDRKDPLECLAVTEGRALPDLKVPPDLLDLVVRRVDKALQASQARLVPKASLVFQVR